MVFLYSLSEKLFLINFGCIECFLPPVTTLRSQFGGEWSFGRCISITQIRYGDKYSSVLPKRLMSSSAYLSTANSTSLFPFFFPSFASFPCFVPRRANPWFVRLFFFFFLLLFFLLSCCPLALLFYQSCCCNDVHRMLAACACC